MTIIDLINDLNDRLDKTIQLKPFTDFEQGVVSMAIVMKEHLERTKEKVLSDN